MQPWGRMTEAELQTAIAEYLARQYPDVLFHSDFGSGIKLTPAQAVRQKRQNGGKRAWPDMFIAQPMLRMFVGKDEPNEMIRLGEEGDSIELANEIYAGLYLELKKEGTRLKKKNGDWATEHIAEQAKVLEKLRDRGYCAEFAVGFEEAKRIIDEYLGG